MKTFNAHLIAATMCLVMPPQAVLASQNQPAPRVQVETGVLEGERDGATDAFLGIPFAAPPVGESRWRAPALPWAWRGVRNAREFGASCWQPVSKAGFGPWTHEYVVQDSVSEDCLYLNVWRPAAPKPASALLPVLVWIHGGGFGSGSGSVPIYNGRHLANKGVVVVTINYRLGIMGFLAHPEITAEATASGQPAGNFGIQDQIAALQWIKRNIARFGGDPQRVTIAGQSAGSVSVHILVTSPAAKGLFGGAIAESGIALPQNEANGLSTAERLGLALAVANGGVDLAGLRKISPDKLRPAAGSGPFFAPVIDGRVVTDSVLHNLALGHFSDVPMIVGQNSDENVSIAAPSDPAAADEYDRFFKDHYGDMADAFKSHFPATDDASRGAALRRARLSNGVASIWQWENARAEHARSPAYVYLFTHREPGPRSNQWKVFHSSEITYAFGTLDAAPERRFSDQDRKISREMSDYWVNFVKFGNPDGRDDKPWKPYSAKHPMMMEIGDQSGMRQPIDPALLDVYAKFLAKGGRINMF